MKKIILLLLILFQSYFGFSQWVQTKGPYGVYAQCFATDGKYLLVGTNNDGIFLSTDSGATWVSSNNGILSTNSVLTSASYASYILAITFSGNNICAGTGYGIFVSTDHGNSWLLTDSATSNFSVSCFATTGNLLFAGTNNTGSGVYVSYDNGISWSVTGPGITSQQEVSSLAVNGDYIFAGTTDSGMFISNDDGASWVKADSGLTGNQVGSIFVSNGKIITSASGLQGGYPYVSTDNGISWNKGGALPSLITSFTQIGDTIFASIGGGIEYSTDGLSWTYLYAQLGTVWAVTSIGEYLFSGALQFGGIKVSKDRGATWSDSETGIINSSIGNLTSIGNTLFAVDDDGGVNTTNNKGANWNLTSIPDVSIYNAILHNGNRIFAAPTEGEILLSTDTGKTWVKISRGIYGAADLVAIDSTVFACADTGGVIVYKRDSTWLSASTGLPNNQVTGGISQLIPEGNNLLLITRSDGIFISPNKGGNWTHCGSLPSGPVEVYAAIAFNGILFLGTNFGLYSSNNNGISWTSIRISDELPYYYCPVNCFAVKGNKLYIGLEIPNFYSGAVFATTDNGNTWESIDGLTEGVESMIIDSNYIYTGVGAQGVWRDSLRASCTASVTIAATSGDTTCADINTVFTAIPINGGVIPIYQWEKNGDSVGTNQATYSDSTLASNDIILCVMTSDDYCASPATVTSNNITMVVNPPVISTISLEANPGTIVCSTTSLTIKATITNGGTSPTFQWQLDGVNYGTNNSLLVISSGLSQGLHTIKCIFLSSLKCTMPVTDSLNITILQEVVPSVSISSPLTSICQTTPVTFTASPTNGGSAPVYQWVVDGVNSGTNSPSYTNNTFSIGTHSVYCIMTSNDSCASPATVNSDTLTITVLPDVIPTVSISSNPGDTICPGTMVTFAATSFNGGSAPTYQWLLNDFIVPANGSGFGSDSLHNGDKIIAFMVSDAQCATPQIVGDTVTIIVTNIPPASPIAAANIASSQATTNWNSVVNATTYYLDVSTTNSFSKFVAGYNNLNVGNVTSYTITGLAATTTYYYRVRANSSCGTSSSSNTISFTTTSCLPLVAGTITPASYLICSDSTQSLLLSGSSGGAFQWQVSSDDITWNNVASGGNDSAYTTLAANGTGNKYYRCLIVNGCYILSGNTVTVDINTVPVITVTNISDTSVSIVWTPSGSGCQSNLSWFGGAGSGSANAIIGNSFTITGLIPDNNLLITVTPLCSFCPGVGAATISAHTLCQAPVVTNVSPTASHGFVVNWTAVAGATSYRVYYRDIASAGSWSYVVVANATNVTITVPFGGHTYAVYVVADNCPTTGSFGQASNPVLYVTTNPPPVCTPAPTVVALSNCPNQLTIDISGTAAPYEITLRRLSPSLTASATYVTTSSTINITLGTQYAGSVWEVFVRKDCGTTGFSVPSNISMVTIKPACPIISNVIASQLTCHGFTASWNTTNCAGLGITAYLVLIKKFGSLKYTAYSVGLTDHDVLTALNSSTAYSLIVEAVACNGASSASSITDTVILPSCRMEIQSPQDSTIKHISNEKEAVTLYPNPSPGQFYVNIDRLDVSEATVKIELFNLLGQVIQTNITTISGGHLTELVNASQNASSGIYIVRTSVGSTTYVNRVVISRE